MAKVQQFLGHTTLAMTMRYVQPQPDDLLEDWIEVNPLSGLDLEGPNTALQLTLEAPEMPAPKAVPGDWSQRTITVTRVLEIEGISMTELARRIGRDKSTLSRYFTENPRTRRTLSRPVMRDIRRVFSHLSEHELFVEERL